MNNIGQYIQHFQKYLHGEFGALLCSSQARSITRSVNTM